MPLTSFSDIVIKLGQSLAGRKKVLVAAPYGLDIVDSCVSCKLRGQGFFCELPAPVLEALDGAKFSAAYPGGAVLFSEGQMPRGVYLLCRGRVKLSITAADGKALILKIAEAGELLGLHAVMGGTPYEMSAETLHPCQINFIRRDDFLGLLKNHGEACLQAAGHLSQNCQSAFDQIRSLGLSHCAREKLARVLLEWAAHGEVTREGTRVKLAMTHEEIAQMIGTSRETVTRILAEFKAKQLAYIKGASLLIRNRAGLERLLA
jgi:CRP/FNR family cyclic AMP-dependent transcriptional regulator